MALRFLPDDAGERSGRPSGILPPADPLARALTCFGFLADGRRREFSPLLREDLINSKAR